MFCALLSLYPTVTRDFEPNYFAGLKAFSFSEISD
jgi:hypothetical protein